MPQDDALGRSGGPAPSFAALASARLLGWTTRLAGKGLLDLRLSGDHHVQWCLRQGRPIVFAGWHGHNFVSFCVYHALLQRCFNGTAIMVPETPQGWVMGELATSLGMHVVKVRAGDDPGPWARATVSLIRHIRQGCCVLLSPDGPSGPARRVKPGIAVIGQQTGALVIPASAAVRRGLRWHSRWDDHLVPLPFTRAMVHFSAPIDTRPAHGPPPDTAELQQRIEKALTEGTQVAQDLCLAPDVPHPENP